jgi:xylan 1,4-beta-xylosidase
VKRGERAMSRPRFVAYTVILGSLYVLAAADTGAGAQSATVAPFPVTLRLDAARAGEPLAPVWRFFGADEPNYAYMKDGRTLLSHLGALRPGEVFFRTHNLLNTGDGTPALKWGSTNAYTEDAQGQPVYDWTIVDRIFDTYLARGVRPYVQIGFMPQALSRKPEPYQHAWRPGLPYDDVFTGWAYPPKDFAKWEELVFRWVSHCVERYSRAEVEQWYWQTWNEANIPYWKGTAEEFHKLHDHAVRGVRRALPTAKVGGPDMAGSGRTFLTEFLEHSLRGRNHATGEVGTPIDFVSFHAKGSPRFEDGRVRMGIAQQLQTIDQGFATIASVPGAKGLPIVIGESDPEGCAACQGPQLAYRSGTMYSSYTAASFARKHDLARKHGVRLEGALTWAFEFEDQPYFAGFRALASNGIDLAVMNVFRMFSRMSGRRVEVTSSGSVPLAKVLESGVRESPDVSALASVAPGRLSILVWHYHDDDVRGPDAAVELQVRGLPPEVTEAKLTHYRVDEHHGNAYGAWKRLGAPIAPNREQYAALQAASALSTLENSPASVRVVNGASRLEFALPRQGVSLIELHWTQ